MRKSNRTGACCALALLIFAITAAPPAFADIALTASTGTGIMYGVVSEIVYATSAYNGKTYVISQLDWEVQPLFYSNAALAMSTSVGFAASLDVRLGVPGKTGFIGDSDWLNYDYNGDSTKTNYSQHDCFTERAILLDAQAGWDLRLADWVTIEPFLAFGLMDFKWSARDGYLQYPPGYPNVNPPYPDVATDSTAQVSGTGIIYQQTYFIPSVGVAGKFRFGKSFGGSVSFTGSPLVFCNDVDNHLFSPGRDFYDTLSYGLLLEPKISLDWQMLAKARLSLDVSYRHIAGFTGTTKIVQTGPGLTPGLATSVSGGAGASYDVLDASVNVVWTF
jgi:outer membrane protease